MRTFIGLLCVVFLAGCVSTRTAQIENGKAGALRGKTVAVTTRPRAGFAAISRGKAMFGVIGGVAMIEGGRELVQEDDIQDPTPVLSRALILAAQTQYGIVPASTAPVQIDTTDVLKLADAASGADVLFDVQQTGSQFRYIGFSSRYVVESGYKFRVIDVHSRALIAEGFCFKSTKDDPTPTTHDELLANKGALLKQTLDVQRDQCASQFEAQVLNISGPQAARN